MSDGHPRIARDRATVAERTTIHLEPDLRRAIEAFARRNRRPAAEVILDALGEYLLQRVGARLPPWVGSVTDAPPTDPSTIEAQMR